MSDQLPRISSVEPAPAALRLWVRWRDGTVADIDMTGAVYRVGAFAPLRDPDAFRHVEVIDAGCAISWPETGLDYSSSSLVRLAEEQAPFGAADFVAWQETLHLSNQEAADFLDVSLSTVKNYRSTDGIPKPVRMACRATLRDPHLLQAHFRPRHPGRPSKSAEV